MLAIILDTNACLLPFLDGTNLEDECNRIVGAHRFVVPSAVAVELDLLGIEDTERGRAARGAQRLIEQFEEIECELEGDDGLLQVARANPSFAVLTNDRAVQRECKKRGTKVIAPRGKGRLHLVA